MNEISPRLKRFVWVALAVLLVYLNAVILARVAGVMLPIIAPFIVAAVIALFMEPVVGFLQHRLRLPRPLATLGSMLLLLASLGLLVALGVLRLIAELGHLSLTLPDQVATLRTAAEGLIRKGLAFYGDLPPSVTEYTDNALKATGQNIEAGLNTIVNGFLSALSGLPGAFFLALIILLGTYFISRDMQRLESLWVRWLPGSWGRNSLNMAGQAFIAFRGYLRAQFVLVSITTIIAILGLMIIDSPYAVSLGLLTGFFDLIPVLGPATVFGPWMVWVVFAGDPGLALKLGVILGVIVVLRQLLEAKVIAMNLGVHPLAVLAAMYVGLKTLGVLGLVLGPVLLIVVQAAAKSYLNSLRGNNNGEG